MRTIATDNAKHRSLRTMTWIACAAKIANAAPCVDLADDALAGREKTDRQGVRTCRNC